MHGLAGSILLSDLKGFSQVEFLTVTDPLGCGMLQLKNQNVTCLSLHGTYRNKSCVSSVTATSIRLHMRVGNVLIIPSLFCRGSIFYG